MKAPSKKLSPEERKKLEAKAMAARRGMNPLAAALASSGVVSAGAVEESNRKELAKAEARLAADETGAPTEALAKAPRNESAAQAIARFEAWSTRVGGTAPVKGSPVSPRALDDVARELEVELPPSFVRFWTGVGGVDLLDGAFSTTPVAKLATEAKSMTETLPRVRELPEFVEAGAAPGVVLIVGVRDLGEGVGYYCVPLRVRDERGEAPVYFAYRDEYRFDRVAGDCDEWLSLVVTQAIERAAEQR